MYGILGPNGAGKSTLINCVTGIIKPDSGSIAFTDGDSHDYMSHLGFLPQNQDFYPNFTARELILYSMALKNVKVDNPKAYADGILKRVNLYDDRNKKVGAHSGGMKQRLGIAQALVGEPKVVIFDEPTAGLDPAGRDEILGLVSKMHRELGITILLVSHSMEDVAEYVDRIIVMNHGAVMFDALPKQVFAHYKELEAVGLAAPQVTYLVHELAERGLPVDTQATTAKEAAQTILSALREKNVI